MVAFFAQPRISFRTGLARASFLEDGVTERLLTMREEKFLLTRQEKLVIAAKALGLGVLILTFMGAIFLPVQQALDSLPF